jgi:hypothetical protein
MKNNHIKSLQIILTGFISIPLLFILPFRPGLELGYAFIPLTSIIISCICAIAYILIYKYLNNWCRIAFWIFIALIIIANFMMIIPWD